MTLVQWCRNGWLKARRPNAAEVANLFAMVRRDLTDASSESISADWRFGIAYNAALTLCTLLLNAEGYRPAREQAHYRAIYSLPLILGSMLATDADYLNECRIKRNIVEYDTIGCATDRDAAELIDFAVALEAMVLEWMRVQHPELMSMTDGTPGSDCR